uniref:Uncharacterized protein n=1 Tax=Heterorhabditis bacteriophora TaxID=37862 RepID=A0A1I7WB82_HETBA
MCISKVLSLLNQKYTNLFFCLFSVLCGQIDPNFLEMGCKSLENLHTLPIFWRYLTKKKNHHNNRSCFYIECRQALQKEEYGTKNSSGRPSKLNDLEKREILRTASSSTISINEICTTCGSDNSESTYIKTKGFTGYGFYEPSKISLLINYLEFRDLRKEPRHFSTRNFGGGSVMVWGAFSRMGLMNSSNYQEVLGHRLVPYVQRFPESLGNSRATDLCR